MLPAAFKLLSTALNDWRHNNGCRRVYGFKCRKSYANIVIMNNQDISSLIVLKIFDGFSLFVMITCKMEQNIDELKKNIDQQFEAQSKMMKSVVHDVLALHIENFKAIIKEEIKKEIDERLMKG